MRLPYATRTMPHWFRRPTAGGERAGAASGMPRGPVASLILLACALSSGCASILAPISGIPARRLPAEFLAEPRADMVPIDLSRLRQPPPKRYLIDASDVLGIYIEGVLGTSEELPPVHFPDRESALPPSIGFPIPVREDGTLALPLIPPIPVRGLTVAQVEDLIRKAYTIDRKILQPGRDRIIVTLLLERTYRVIVIREDSGTELALPGGGRITTGVQSQVIAGTTRKGTGEVLELPAYENDLMHALARTGGLPGLNAKAEVKILRANRADTAKRDRFIREFYQLYSQSPCMCPPPLPDDPSILKVSLRLHPGETPQFKPEDILLHEGDIVYIEARETEFFYTGGYLQGGQWPLPRDYDIDVVGAVAVAGYGIGGGQTRSQTSFLVPGVLSAAPTQLFVLRKTPCNGQVIISIDLTGAVNDPKERILVQAGDTLILRYKPIEEITNFGIGTFFTYGIQQLFNGGRR